MTLEQFVQKGFEDHAEDAAGVFARLPNGVALVCEAKHLPGIANLIAHVGGQHLARWDESLALLERLERLPVFDAASPQGKAVLRSKAILARCAGDRDASERFAAAARSGHGNADASDRIRVLALAAEAFAGQRRTAEARSDLEEALALAAYGPDRNDPASRTLAVSGHNIAAEYENAPAIDDDERQLMLRAAQASLTYWKVAGGWLEEERAHYRLALSHVKAGDAVGALRHARECLHVVETNGPDLGEAFFAHEAIARAHLAAGDRAAARGERAAMSEILPRIADALFREFAATELSKLDAELAAG